MGLVREMLLLAWLLGVGCRSPGPAGRGGKSEL